MGLKVPTYTVSQINQYLKKMMDRDELLSALFIRGEISNYKRHQSGHHFFSLKDAGGAIRCVMYQREAARLRFRPENGMNVVAFGRISVYPRDGQYQLYCQELIPDGTGDLHTAFEQLKDKLFREGLFDEKHKKPLPQYPRKIAVITSPTGAAVRDMLRILNARYPVARVVLLPVRVQGDGAAEEIANAIDLANALEIADLIITGRGGGSMEDLWAFNEECVARAIFRSAIPVISAVGHEPDVTISDFAADYRAATPSNAAERAVPDKRELSARFRQQEQRMAMQLSARIGQARKELERLGHTRVLTDPRAFLEDRSLYLDGQMERMRRAMMLTLERSRNRLAQEAAGLHAMSPLAVLGRGYAIVRKGNGEVVRSHTQTEVGDSVAVRLADSTLSCRVEKKGSAGNGGEKADF